MKVIIDAVTGSIQVFKADKEVKSGDFGRIAAQMAKQIITQKIREAEREVIHNDFQEKVGDITNGTVHRFEKGNIIVDLGKAEGVLSFRELLPKEEFRQGDRVRALIVDVKRTNKGPQIVLSRTNSGFVKRLFELEVPEIYEGIVEIKSIARLAGERTKVAVSSKDDKIDCVGACVGVRVSIIKNIVRELHGEKVDIVRWHDDVNEYVKAALNPAKILELSINEAEKKIDLVIDDEFLSLAIGKKGQNVRLASKLVGWSINIGSSHPKEENKKMEKAEKALSGADINADVFELLKSIGDKTKVALIEAGFNSIEALANSSIKELTQAKGVGAKRAEQIIEEAKKLL